MHLRLLSVIAAGVGVTALVSWLLFSGGKSSAAPPATVSPAAAVTAAATPAPNGFSIPNVTLAQLAKFGFFVEDASDNAVKITAVTAESNARALDASLKVVNRQLVWLSQPGTIYADKKLAWAISFDPSTYEFMPAGPPVDSPRQATPAYAVCFVDANTGELLAEISQGSLN
jgi:hypothetical protein